MESSANQFKNAIDKEYSKISLNTDTISDANKYKSGFTEEMSEEKLKSGTSDNKKFEDLVNKNKSKGKDISVIEKELKTQLNKGIKKELEHTKDKTKAKKIAMDHLFEDPKYYDKLKKIENKEATGSGSSGSFSGPIGFKDSDFVRNSFKETPKLKESHIEKVEAKEATTTGSSGGYETPAMWAKSTSKKDWGPSRKTQYKGGSFVKVKKKCTKFPYCNQGDINALKLSKNESVKEAIYNVSNKLGICQKVIMNILEHEYENMSKRIK